MKRIAYIFLLVFMVSCGNATSLVSSTATNVPQATITFTPTLTPTITPTEDPLANAPEGTTSVSPDGKIYYMDTTENGVNYHFTYNKETEKWTREVGKFPLWDDPSVNFIPFTIRINSDVKGGQNLVSLTHKDFTMNDIPASGRFNPPPLSATFEYELQVRYFDNQDPNSDAHQIQIQEDMLGENNQHTYLPTIHAYMPIITSSGEKVNGILSTETGFILDIVNSNDLKPIIGKGVNKWTDPWKNTFYIQVTGVDTSGNILIKEALDGDISALSDKAMRWFLFEGVGNIINHEDQREFDFLNLQSQAFATWSAKLQADHITQDVVIVRNP